MPNIKTAARRIQVLQLIGNAIVGGMETYVMRLIERLPPERFEVTVLCPFESVLADRLRGMDVEVHVTPMPESPSWSSINMTSSLIKAYGIHVLHAHLPNAHLLAALAGRLTGTPVLTTIHGRQLSILDMEVHRAAGTHLSAVCQQTYFHALGLGVNRTHLHFIPNGVDLSVFKPRRVRQGVLRQRLGIDEQTPLVGLIGRLSPEKGPDVFLRAAMAVKQSAPQARFVVVGDGPLRGDMERLIERLELSGVVHLAGLVSDMPSVYGELDIVVSSSRSEAMPLALMEAMASGLPVVATRVGGVPDLIQHGMTGWVVGDGDFDAIATHVLTLLGDANLRDEMGARGRERAAERMSLDSCIQATGQLLAQLAVRESESLRSSTAAAPAKALFHSVETSGNKAAAG